MEPPRKPQGITPHAVFLQDVCDSIRANRILPGLGYRLKESPAGTVLEIAQRANRTPFHPFKIYKVGDLKYAVRAGYVGIRSANGQFNSPSPTDNAQITGNGETLCLAHAGSDGVYTSFGNNDFWSSSTTPDPNYTIEDLAIPNASDVGVSNTLHGATFTLDSGTDIYGQRFASFWVEVVDGSPPVAQIKARMWSMDGSLSRPFSPFPTLFGNGSNQTTIIFPIGVLVPKDFTPAVVPTAPLMVRQFMVDHKINNYAPGVPNGSAIGGTMGPCYWRGEFAEDSLSGGVYFYDGDMVSYDNAGTRELWIHKGIGLETGINANFRKMVD